MVIIAITMGNKSLLILFLLVILCCCGVVGAVATHFSISDLNALSPRQDVEVYYAANGTLFGQYNTSSTNIDVPDEDFSLIMRPSAVSRLTDPSSFLSDAFDYMETYWLQIVLLLVVLGIFWGGRK